MPGMRSLDKSIMFDIQTSNMTTGMVNISFTLFLQWQIFVSHNRILKQLMSASVWLISPASRLAHFRQLLHPFEQVIVITQPVDVLAP